MPDFYNYLCSVITQEIYLKFEFLSKPSYKQKPTFLKEMLELRYRGNYKGPLTAAVQFKVK